MSMFKKSKKNFRSRQVDEQSEEEVDDDVIIESFVPASCLRQTPEDSAPKKIKKKKKEKEDKKSKTASTLSFAAEDEGDGEVFQIKKSSHSRRVAKMLKREHKKEREEAEQRKKELPASGNYSEESLRQLRLEQDSHNNGHTPVDMELGSDSEVAAGEGRRSTRQSEEEEEEPEDGGESTPEADRPHDPLAGPNFRDMITGGQIPDAALIHLARKRRQLARERGEDGFIPLDDTRRAEKNTSRLVREDDNDRSDEDEEERLNFATASREQELRKIQNTILEAEQGSHSEGSDQERDWEEQQIRKGVQAGVAAQGEMDNTTKQFQQFFFGSVPPSGYTNSSHPDTGANIVASRSAPPKNLPPVTLELIKKRLQDRLDELTSIHRAHKHERDDIESRMENCSVDIGGQSGGKGSLEGRYRFFQQMRGYVRDLVECLAEKITSINYLDRCLMQQWEKRSDKLVKRRQQDVKDQSKDYMPHKVTVPPSLSPEEVEEDLARQRRSAEREARRARRRRAREAASITNHHDGMSTDDEENKSDSAKYQLERGHVHSSVQTMFDDVLDDFHDVNLIKSRFEDWKKEQGSTYSEAYIGLCLPKLFSPIIKWKLIEWNPLEPYCRSLDERDWYEALMFYGFYDDKHPDEDSDLKLVPSIVEKVVVSKLTVMVETIWDPLSAKQTKRLSALVSVMVQDYPTISSDSKNTQALTAAIVQRIRKTLDDDVFVPLYPKQVLENKNSGASQFSHRQLWTCVKLLGNIMTWHGILSDSALQQLGLDYLLNRYMVIALHNSPINAENLAKCQAITSSFPSSWFSGLQTDSTMPQLQNLCRHLVNAATTFGQAMLAAETDAVRFTARESLKQIRKMLVNLHALDHASGLAEKFSMRS